MDPLHDWPWLALALALPLLALLLRPRPPGAPPRWEDPRWIINVGLPLYMLHQFEEHGVDLLGRVYSFQPAFCEILGYHQLDRCPADAAFVMAVNVGAVWIAFLSGMIAGPRRAMVGAAALGIPLVNALMHLVPALLRGAYNPGLASAALLLAPLAFFGLRGLVRAGRLDRRRIAVVVAVGVVTHAALVASALLRARGLLSHGALLGIQIGLGFVPLAVGLAVGDAERGPAGARP
ncbi:MAG: HXXEE domain-containing protein [Myxococcales bacterium]|nr:HXXEE domain-containing protein [Myxococcales bacterium]